MSTALTASKGAILDMDHVLPLIGEFAKYQIILESIFCFAVFGSTFQLLIVYFGSLDPGWQCVTNSTVCRLNGTITSAQRSLYGKRCNLPREEWTYAEPKDYSIITQFDLHCDTQPLAALSSSVIFIGWGVGAIFLGWLADKFGRKKILIPSLFLVLFFGLIGAWSPNIVVFITFRFIVGLFIPGTTVQMFIIMSEFVGPKKRAFASTFLWIFSATALVILGIKAYFIRKWKTLFIVSTAPYFLVLLFAWFIPESTRWQHVNGKIDSLMHTIKKIARVNGKEPPNFALAPITDRRIGTNTSSPLEIFRGRKMSIRTLIQGLAWFVNGMVYYGLSLAADKLSGNIYRDFILTCSMGIPAIVCTIYSCNRFGRKKSTMYPMFIGGIACILVAVIPEGTSAVHWNTFRVIFGIFGRFCITVSFDSVYVYSVELYPTSVRAAAMGFMQICARSGSAASPWIASSLSTVHKVLPFSLMGGSAFASACLIFFLPETKGKKTKEIASDSEDDSVEEEKDFKKEEDGVKLINPLYKEEHKDLGKTM